MERIEERFEYTGYHGCESFCQVEIYGNPEALILVVMTELADNEGTSITNRSEAIATKICKQYNLAPLSCNFVEHYGPMSYREGHGKDEYNIVTYLWQDGVASKPEWRTVTPDGVENLKQEALSL